MMRTLNRPIAAQDQSSETEIAGMQEISACFEIDALQASFPRSNSVKGAVLADLLSGDCLTHMDVWKRHASSRAAHHIHMLRKAGWPIETHEMDVPTSDGRVARIAQYRLIRNIARAAGEAGRQFVADVRKAQGV